MEKMIVDIDLLDKACCVVKYSGEINVKVLDNKYVLPLSLKKFCMGQYFGSIDFYLLQGDLAFSIECEYNENAFFVDFSYSDVEALVYELKECSKWLV